MLGIAPDGKCGFPRTSPPLLNLLYLGGSRACASESILIESSHECVSDAAVVESAVSE